MTRRANQYRSVRARPGPRDWGSSWEGLTQTRPALLSNAGALREWVPKSRGPGGFRVPRGGGVLRVSPADLPLAPRT